MMAPSLNGLIDFLLSEVALCGQQGASPSDILKFIDEFYANLDHDDAAATGVPAQVIDRPFQEKVWSWLTRNPEVSVGKDREGNGLSLSEAEAVHQQQLENGASAVDTGAASSVADDPPRPLNLDSSPRVRVSLERTWLAITGHEPDETKVFPTEFELLSIIASRKERGIVQIELITLSGQDKRSVPKRTDALQQKGYIQKRPIQFKSTRTSLCTLRKFVQDTPTYNTMATPADTEKKPAHLPDYVMDFGILIGKLFEVLRERQIIAREDLKSILGFADAWRWKILSRTLRKFERLGCLKRVRAPSQFSDMTKTLHSCVMFIRDPTKSDLERFDENLALQSSSLTQENSIAGDLEDDLEAESILPSLPEADGAGEPIRKQDIVQDGGRIYPKWTPDRNIHNQIFDIIHGSGTSGIINPEITRIGFGSFYRRPLENVLTRLVERWQLSQPPHLRHLALVRDVGLNKTVTYYIHYSAENFGKLVDSGSKDWAAVSSSTQKVKAIDPDLDTYGFPRIKSLPGLLKGGDASLYECVAAVKPADYRFSSSDPRAVKLADGTFTVIYRKRQENRVGSRPVSGKKRMSGSSALFIPGKRTIDQVDFDADQSTRRANPPKKFSKKDPSSYAGMTEKQYLEALGLDETWTEYNVYLIPRDGPGVYMTPRGKKRPTGKRQGRPKISRIAIFKSERLRELAWFVDDASQDRDPVGRRLPAVPSHGPESGGAGDVPTGTSLASMVDHSQASVVTSSKRRRPSIQMDADGPENIVECNEPPNKKLRLQAQSPQLGRNHTVVSNKLGGIGDSSKGDHVEPNPPNYGMTPNNLSDPTEGSGTTVSIVNGGHVPEQIAEGTPTSPSIRLNSLPMGQNSLPDRLPEVAEQTQQFGRSTWRKSRKKAFEIGGSVAVLRRKIILDIVDACGGVYPLGTELWYPFTTAWFKTKANERPDLRTIKSTVKYMIDSGQLRQLTFSGKDIKGIMVTKRVIIRPHMSPDDPKVKDMQQKMLSCTGRFYIPPDAEVDPKLSKSMKGAFDQPSSAHIDRQVEPGTVVQLMGKPALVLAKERRTEQKQKRLSSTQSRSAENTTQDSGVIRLKKLRPSAQKSSPLVATGAILSRPGFGTSVGPAGIAQSGDITKSPSRRGRPPRFLVRALAPFTMLMNPLQRFHTSTGTFSSGGVRPPNKRSGPSTIRIRPHLPESLKDILSTTQCTQDYSNKLDARSSKFFQETDAISKWEIQNPDLFETSSRDLVYIHQNVEGEFEGGPSEVQEFSFIEGDGRIRPPSKLHVVTRQATRSVMPSTQNAPMTTPIIPQVSAIRHPQHQLIAPKVPIAPMVPVTPIVRPAAAESMPAKITEPKPTQSVEQERARQSINRPINRRKRLMRNIPQTVTRKLVSAIVVVRTLAGGAEGKNVDWDIVAGLFPDYDPQHVQDRAKHILSKNRLQIAKMQSDFQAAFLEAYDIGNVPSIDYNNLDAYEWELIVKWADRNMEILTTPNKVVTLPATREQFDNLFEIREEEATTGLADIYQYNPMITQTKRRIIYANETFAIPLTTSLNRSVKVQRDPDRLEIARSWVRANALASDESYNGLLAVQALQRLGGDPLLGNALQSLMTDRSLTTVNKGRPTPGRQHTITDYFSTMLNRKRAIDASVLKRAARFKRETLDRNFRQEAGFAEIKYDAEDGDILAAINLVATGQAVFTPRDPPRERFGLTVGGYQTRAIEREKLLFAVDIRPSPGVYQLGNPIEEKVKSVPPPRGDMDLGLDSPAAAVTFPGRIPLWFDIHRQFKQSWWEQAVASVVGIIAIRPGINASGLARMVKPTMSIWDVRLVLEWLVRIDVVEPTISSAELESDQRLDRGAWKVKEWWWLVCG